MRPLNADELLWEKLLDAARDFIRDQDGCAVGIGELLGHQEERFGKSCGLTSNVGDVISLCTLLWEDPRICQVAQGWIEFAWIVAAPKAASGIERNVFCALLPQKE